MVRSSPINQPSDFLKHTENQRRSVWNCNRNCNRSCEQRENPKIRSQGAWRLQLLKVKLKMFDILRATCFHTSLCYWLCEMAFGLSQIITKGMETESSHWHTAQPSGRNSGFCRSLQLFETLLQGLIVLPSRLF